RCTTRRSVLSSDPIARWSEMVGSWLLTKGDIIPAEFEKRFHCLNHPVSCGCEECRVLYPRRRIRKCVTPVASFSLTRQQQVRIGQVPVVQLIRSGWAACWTSWRLTRAEVVSSLRVAATATDESHCATRRGIATFWRDPTRPGCCGPSILPS